MSTRTTDPHGENIDYSENRKEKDNEIKSIRLWKVKKQRWSIQEVQHLTIRCSRKTEQSKWREGNNQRNSKENCLVLKKDTCLQIFKNSNTQ